jgi:hypothetical protein
LKIARRLDARAILDGGWLPMSREDATRDLLRRYLAGEIDLVQFQESFIPLSSNITIDESGADAEMADAIDSALVRLSSGELTEDELRSELLVVIGRGALIYWSDVRLTVSNEPQIQHINPESESAGISIEAASG